MTIACLSQFKDGAKRFGIISQIAENIWTAIFTMREPFIRIISCRRARKNEEALYKNEKEQ